MLHGKRKASFSLSSQNIDLRGKSLFCAPRVGRVDDFLRSHQPSPAERPFSGESGWYRGTLQAPSPWDESLFLWPKGRRKSAECKVQRDKTGSNVQCPTSNGENGTPGAIWRNETKRCHCEQTLSDAISCRRQFNRDEGDKRDRGKTSPA